MRKKVVLVHGYNKNQNDMFILKENLTKLNYNVELVDLPLTFKKIEYCTSVFKERIEQIISDMCKNEKISLAGHSTGGLIIRHFLSNTKYKTKIDRCVLIATPNQGSQLANIASRLSDTFINVFKTLDSLSPDNLKNLELENSNPIEIGAIAGNRSNLILGSLLQGENDGRVQVDSVRYEGLKDFIVIPYGHKEIHYKFKTAKLVDSFLRDGEF
ncbi:alpha/beta fold hydrolase [Sporohalobacter salinus]|uniref:alpha/beta fold hydrolase n=1 Tax=Sporohalobacter salinus TaxID=1494606 RepID=UPI0019607A2C|nr:alpha/beta fold hydrolase [Sporohalobacter salinus]MBM7622524.1 pimeloyl-ACP methyl ester carboxylesterase [Sporohalobacter salinus]